jgi:hypothetical protein
MSEKAKEAAAEAEWKKYCRNSARGDVPAWMAFQAGFIAALNELPILPPLRAREEIARALSIAVLGDDVEWQAHLSLADRFTAALSSAAGQEWRVTDDNVQAALRAWFSSPYEEEPRSSMRKAIEAAILPASPVAKPSP